MPPSASTLEAGPLAPQETPTPEVRFVEHHKDPQEEPVVEVVVKPDTNPAQALHRIGVGAMNGAGLRVVDGRTGNALDFVNGEQAAQPGEDTGELFIGFGPAHVGPDGSLVTNVEVLVRGNVPPEAQVTVAEIGQRPFISSSEHAPTFTIDADEAELATRQVNGERPVIGPGVSAMAALAVTALMSSRGSEMFFNDGSHIYHSHPPRYDD